MINVKKLTLKMMRWRWREWYRMYRIQM